MDNKKALWEYLSSIKYTEMPYEQFEEVVKDVDNVAYIYKYLLKNNHTKQSWGDFNANYFAKPKVDDSEQGVVLDPNDDTPEINQEPQELGKPNAATDSISEDGSSELSVSKELNRVANIRRPESKEEVAQAAYKKEFAKIPKEMPSMFDYQDQVDISNDVVALKKQQEEFSPISEDFANLQEQIDAKNKVLAENNSDRTVKVMSEKRAIDQKYEALQKRNEESYKALLNSVGAGKGVTEQIEKQKATFEKEKQDAYLSKFTKEQLEEFKAIDQIIKDTNSNTSVTLEGDRDIVEDMGQGAGEAWGIVDKRNLQESEKIQLNSKVEAELLSSLNRRDREQAFKGHMPLAKKNALVKQARMKVLNNEIKAFEKELSTKGDQLAIDIREGTKQLELTKTLFGKAKADGDIDKANSYVDQFNALQASIKAMAEEGEALESKYLEGVDELYGLYGYTVGKGMADAFRLIKLQETNRRANKGKGTNLVNAGFEAVINTGKNVVYGGIGTAMGMFGDLFTDSEGYSSYDAWNDMIEQSTNYDYAQVQGEDLLTADGGINTDPYAMGLNLVQMVPFTAELIRQVRTGQYGSLTKATGRILGRGKRSGDVLGGLSKELKNNIIMADATYRMTIVDNLKEAEREGLTGIDAQIFANTKSVGTAVIQSVMPDNLLVGGNAKALFANLSGTLKNAAGRQAKVMAGKQFVTNFAKEQLEENIDYGFGELVNFSFGLAEDKELADYLKGVKETAWGTTLLTGPMSAYGARKTKRQLNDMLINQFTVHGVESLEYLKVLGQKAKESGHLEEVAKLEKAYNYGMDLIAMAKMDKKAVTIEQLELLNKKVTLEGRLSEATGKEAQDLQDNLDVLDNKIEARADEVRKTRVHLDIVKANKIAEQTGAFDVIDGSSGNDASVAALLKRGAFDENGELFSEEALRELVDTSMGFAIDVTGDQSAIAGVEAELAEANKKDKRTKAVKAEIAALKEKVKAVRKADGNSAIVINQDAALEAGYTTTAQHEVLHVVMKKALRSNPELAQALGAALEQDLASIERGGGQVGQNFKARKAQYRNDADEQIDQVEQWASSAIEAARKSFMSENTNTTEAEYERILDEVTQTKIDQVAAAENEYNEELLNLVSESLARMETSDVLKMPQGKFGRIIDFFSEFALNAGLKKFNFQSEEGKLNVYGFIQRYNKEFEKGKLSRATKRLLDTGTNFTFTSAKEADEVTKKVDKVAGIRKSLNTRVPVAWTDSENKTESNKININGNTYSITMSDTADMGGTKKDLAVQFYAYDANSNKHQRLVGSSKNSIRALAAIKNAIVDKALSMGAESVTFTGKEENSRTSVYERMAQLTAKELGWGLDVIPISAMDENFELGNIDDLLAMNVASMENTEYVEFKAFKLPNSTSVRQSKMPSDLTMKIYNAKTDRSMDLYDFTDMAYDAYVEYGKQDKWLVDSIAEQWVNVINKGLKTGKFGKYGAWAESVGDEAVRAFAEKVAYGKGSQTVAGLVGSFKPGTSVKIDAEAGGVNEGKTVSLSGYINKYLGSKVNWWFREEEVISETDKEAEEDIKYYEKQIAEAKAEGDFELMATLQEDLEEVKKSSQSQLKSFSTSSIDSDNNITQLADSDALSEFEFDSNTTDEQVVKAAPGAIETMRGDVAMERLRFNLYEEDLQTAAIAAIDETLATLFAERGKHVTKDPFAKALKDYLKRNEEKTGKLLKLIERYKADEFISKYMEYVINKAELTFFKASPLSRVKEGKIKSTGKWVQQTKVDGKYVYVHPTTKKVMGAKDPDWKREDAKSGDLGAGKYIKRRIKNAIHLPGFKAELLDYYYPKGLDAKPDKRKLRPLAMELAGELGTEMVMTQIQNPGSEIHAAMEEVLGNMSAEQESVVGEATAKDIATEARFQMLKDGIANGLTDGLTNKIIESLERKGFNGVRQSKVTGQVGKTGFPWFDNPRIKYTNFLKAVGPDLAKKLQLGEIRNEEFEDLRAKVEDAHYDYLTQMAEADAWEDAQAEYLQIFKDRNFNDWGTFENDLVTQASLDSESMLSLQKGESDFGKGAKAKIKTTKKEGVMSYINDTLSRDSVPQEAKEGLFGALIKQLLGATAAPLDQGLYLNTEGFFNEVVVPTVKKFKMNPNAFKLIQVTDGQSISLNGTKITSDLTKGVYSSDVFEMVNSLVSGEALINNSVDVTKRIEEAEEAQQLFMFYSDWLADNFTKMNKVSVSMMMNSMFSKLRAIGPHMQPITKAVLTQQNVLLNDYTTVPTIPKDFIIAQALQYVYADGNQKVEKRAALEELIASGETAILPRFYADVIRQLSPRTPRVGFMSPEVKNKLIQMGMPALPLTDLSTAKEIATVDLEDSVKVQDYKNNIGMIRQSKLAPTKSLNIEYAEDVLDGKVKMTPGTMLITRDNPMEVMEELMDQGIAMTTDQLTQIDGEAKLLQGLASQGYNDITGVKFSKKPGIDGMLNLVNKNSAANKKQKKEAISLNKRINGILERKTKGKMKTERKVTKAEAAGKKGSKSNLFISSMADDFQGLLYRLIPSAKDGGNQDWEWMKKVLIDPYVEGVTALDDTNVLIGQKYKELAKKHDDVFKKLGNNLKNTVLTVDQAVRAAVFSQDPENASIVREDVGDDALVRVLSAVNQDPQLKSLVEDLKNILNVNQQGGTTIKMSETWFNKSIATEFMSLVSTAHRKANLSKWSDNVDLVFNEATLNKLTLLYGESYTLALTGAIRRMRLGTKGISDVQRADYASRQVIDWMSNAVLPIMFLNAKSAVLQLLSLTNFINTSDNNPAKMAWAMVSNPKQYIKDLAMIWNSNKLVQRRSKLRMSIEEAEIANIRPGDGQTGAYLQYIARSIGFLPTKYADSFAIAFGGASFYRNRLNSLIKQGMAPKEAEKQAWLDFSEISDQAQQSSDQMYISAEQASTLGRVIMAFANTPAQYARMIKKASLDLANGRGSAVNNLSKIAYYGLFQNAFFGLLQSMLFGLMIGDDDEWLVSDEELAKIKQAIKDEKDPLKKKQMRKTLKDRLSVSRMNTGKKSTFYQGMINSLLRGMGYRGAAIAAIKDGLLEYANQQERVERGEGQLSEGKVISKILGVSPVLGSKVNDIRKIINLEKYKKDAIEHFGYKLWNPRYYEAALALRVLTNNPILEFSIRKLDYARQYLNNEEKKISDAAALIAGYSPYSIDLPDEQMEHIEDTAEIKKALDAEAKKDADKMRKALIESLAEDKMTPAEKAKRRAEGKSKRSKRAKQSAATKKANEKAARQAAWERMNNQ